MKNDTDLRSTLQAVARSLGIPGTPDQWLSGAPFQVNGQVFSLQQPPGDGATGMLVLRSELGEVPPAMRLQVCEMLLRSNALAAGAFSPIAGMQLDGTGFVMDMPLQIASLTTDMLYGVLDRMAESAAVWKATQGFTKAPDGSDMLPATPPLTSTAAAAAR